MLHMECEEAQSSSAQPKATRGARRCPAPITSFLGSHVARISRMVGPIPRLGITPDDQDGPGGAVDPDEGPQVSNNRQSISTPSAAGRSASVMGTGNLRFSIDPSSFREDSVESDIKTGNLRFASETSESVPIKFLPPTYGERSNSMDSDVSGVRMPSCPDFVLCKPPVEKTKARDTMGLNFFMSSISRCPEGTTCYEECGYGTGCEAQCRLDHGVKPGSTSEIVPDFAHTVNVSEPGAGVPLFNDFQRGFASPGGPGGYSGGPARPGGPGGPGGYPGRPGSYTGGHPDGRYMSCPEACQHNGSTEGLGTGQLNFYIMLLLEVFGVLIFFAICTITFWLTLAYHVIKLLVELKNADRNVQVAVAIVFGLLLLAFAICHVTQRSGSCCNSRDRSRGHWTRSGSLGHHKSRAKTKNTSTIAMMFTQIKKAFTFGGGSSRRRSSSCRAKKGVAPSRRKHRYSDCEGRAIFISSRRYAIPTEMKQPPTIVLWLLDVLGRFMSQHQ